MEKNNESKIKLPPARKPVLLKMNGTTSPQYRDKNGIITTCLPQHSPQKKADSKIPEPEPMDFFGVFNSDPDSETETQTPSNTILEKIMDTETLPQEETKKEVLFLRTITIYYQSVSEHFKIMIPIFMETLRSYMKIVI